MPRDDAPDGGPAGGGDDVDGCCESAICFAVKTLGGEMVFIKWALLESIKGVILRIHRPKKEARDCRKDVRTSSCAKRKNCKKTNR